MRGGSLPTSETLDMQSSFLARRLRVQSRLLFRSTLLRNIQQPEKGEAKLRVLEQIERGRAIFGLVPRRARRTLVWRISDIDISIPVWVPIEVPSFS